MSMICSYPQDHPVIVSQIGEFPAPTQGSRPYLDDPQLLTALQTVDFTPVRAYISRLDRVLGPYGAAIGSNSWAISGQRSATGKPLLANDPHLG